MIDDDGTRKKTELQMAEESAYKHTILFHYTSFETLKLIFENRNLKFNRIDYVNDRLEHIMFGEDELSHLVFVSCFSTDEVESIPMWSIYGKNEHGLRISIEFNKRGFVESLIDRQRQEETLTSKSKVIYKSGKLHVPNRDWQYTVKAKDIVYDIDAIKRNPIRHGSGNEQWFDLTAMAAIKRREWQYEHECRIIATLRTTQNNVEAPDIDYILIPIQFKHIKKIGITFNPWMDAETKKAIKQFISSISDISDKVTFADSVLEGEITEL